MRIEQLANRWLTEQQYADTTRVTYGETLSRLARRFPIPVERITDEHLIDFLTLDDNGARTRRAPATVGRERTTLRCFFRWGHRRGYLKADPAARLDELMVGRGKRRAGRWLTRPQVRDLLASIDTSDARGQRDYALIAVTVLTGLRRAEIARLRWRDIDLEQATLSVVGKGAKPAVVGLPEEACAALDVWRSQTRQHQGRQPAQSAAVFCTGQRVGGLYAPAEYRMHWGRPMTGDNVRRIIAAHAEAVGLGVVATHDLRRTFAGWLDEDGCDLKGIQAALRHSSPGVTVSCYLDPSPRRALDAVRTLQLGL